MRHLVPFLRRRFRPHDEGFAPRVQRGLLDPPRVLTYSPYHCRFGRKRGNIVGRRRDEVSLFELLRDSERSQPSDPAEGTSGEVAEEAVSANQDSSATHGSRRKVALDDRAKKIPVVRRLAPISDSITSASSGDSGADSSAYRSFLSEVVEIRIATILVFSIATLIAIAVAFIAGREFAVVSPPAGMNEMPGAAPPWPVLDPEPELRPAIRNVKQDGVVAAADTGEIVEGTPVNPVVVAPQPRTLWSVMIGQHLSKDPQVIDQLVRYVDSGLSFSQARVRVSTSRGGRTFSVFVGPFKEQEQARSALRELQSLRPYLGVRFRDAYPTRMVFSPEELEKYGSGI